MKLPPVEFFAGSCPSYKKNAGVVVPVNENRKEKVNGHAKFENAALRIKISTFAFIAMNFPAI